MKRELKARAGEWETRPEGPPGSSWELGVFYMGCVEWRWSLHQRQVARVQQQVGAPGSCLVREQALENSVCSAEMSLESCPSAQCSEWGVRHENLEHEACTTHRRGAPILPSPLEKATPRS